jgi:hypothetical protein
MERVTYWFGRLKGVLWQQRWLVGFLLLLLVLRAAAPLALRPFLAAQASAALNGRVEIGDLDLWLLRGAVALNNVAVFPESPEAPAVVAWKRFYVRLQWTGLLKQSLHFSNISVDSPYLGLDRLENGDLNLLALVDLGSEETPEPSAAEGSDGWTVDIDRLAIDGGRVVFRDFKVGNPQSLGIEIERVKLERISLSPKPHGEPAHVELTARIDGVPFLLDASVGRRNGGFDLRAKIESKGLILRPARFYIPGTGWSELQGLLDVSLNYRLETDTHNELRGRLALRDLMIEVPGLDRPALRWRSLAAELDQIDLLARRATLKSVDLDGASLVLRLQESPILPLMPAQFFQTAATVELDVSSAEPSPQEGLPTAESEEAKTAMPAPGPDVEDASGGTQEAPWRWAISHLSLNDAHLILLGKSETLDIGLQAVAQNLTGENGDGFPFQIKAQEGDASLTSEGTLRLQPIGFQGVVGWDLSLPRLLSVAEVETARLIQMGRTRGELEIFAGLPAPATPSQIAEPPHTPASAEAPEPSEVLKESANSRALLPGTVRLQGRLEVSGLSASGDNPDEFFAGWNRIDVGIGEILLPGLLPGLGETESQEPIVLRFDRIHLVKPLLQLTRTADGFFLPLSVDCESRSESALEAGSSREKAGSATVSGSPGEGEASADTKRAGVEVAVAELEVEDGELIMVDRSIEPVFRGQLSAITLKGRTLMWPDLQVADLSLEVKDPKGRPVRVTGKVETGNVRLKVSGNRLALSPFNPYVSKYAGYTISKGQASLTSSIGLQGDRYSTKNKLVLHNFNLKGKEGEHLFREQFGLPLSLALALMRDVRGNITLDLPVAGDASGAKVGLLATIGGVLRRAILNAVTSPLKMIGAVIMRGDKVEEFYPEPILFPAGQTVLASEATAQVEKLAALLNRHPALIAELKGSVGLADLRWLREQDLLAELQKSNGQAVSDEGSSELSPQEVIRGYLEAHAAGKPVKLPEAEQAMLKRLLSAKEISPQRLADLASQRASRVREILQQDHSVPAGQIELKPITGDLTGGAPAVLTSFATSSS